MDSPRGTPARGSRERAPERRTVRPPGNHEPVRRPLGPPQADRCASQRTPPVNGTPRPAHHRVPQIARGRRVSPTGRRDGGNVRVRAFCKLPRLPGKGALFRLSATRAGTDADLARVRPRTAVSVVARGSIWTPHVPDVPGHRVAGRVPWARGAAPPVRRRILDRGRITINPHAIALDGAIVRRDR